MDPNVFETANAGFAQAMYEEFLRDPAAVGPEWRRLFESGVVGERDGGTAGQRDSGTAGKAPGKPPVATSNASPADGLLPSSRPAVPLTTVPLKGPAAKLVANMNESLTVPTATTFRELPVAALEERRRTLNTAVQAAGRSEKISFTHLIAYAIVQATKQHRVMGHTLVMQEGVPFRVQPEGIATLPQLRYPLLDRVPHTGGPVSPVRHRVVARCGSAREGHLKVLLVDDDADLLDLMTYALRREGFTVTTAMDGQQAPALRRACGGFARAPG